MLSQLQVIYSIHRQSDTSFAVGYSSVEMLIFSMSRLKIRMAACNIWSSLQESDSIVVQIQRGQGKFNLVFSSDVSIGHVVATAGNLKSKLKTSEIKQEISTVADSCNDDQISNCVIRKACLRTVRSS
jgi:hypothetical protein